MGGLLEMLLFAVTNGVLSKSYLWAGVDHWCPNLLLSRDSASDRILGSFEIISKMVWQYFQLWNKWEKIENCQSLEVSIGQETFEINVSW